METNPNYDNLDRQGLVARLKELLAKDVEVSEIKSEVETLRTMFYGYRDSATAEDVAPAEPQAEAPATEQDKAEETEVQAEEAQAEQPAEAVTEENVAEPATEETPAEETVAEVAAEEETAEETIAENPAEETVSEPAAEETVAETAEESTTEVATEENTEVATEEAATEEQKPGEMPSVEKEFKALLAEYGRRRKALTARIEAERQENLRKKLEILTALEALSTPQDNVNDVINKFHDLQNQWKAIGPVPQQDSTDVYNRYKVYQEQFYDLIRINAALRDLDFKRNLEQKEILIKQAEALLEMDDVVKATQSLQNLHSQWREIGPVAKEIREEIWNRFKEVSSAVNRRHVEFFEKVKETERAVAREKEEYCRQVEQINYDELTSMRAWDEKSKEIKALAEKFHSDNPYERRINAKMYARYRMACNKFFEAKHLYYEQVNTEYAANIDKKRSLAEQAERLKSSSDWQATARKLQELQREWKEVGTVPRRLGDELWRRFRGACDEFFARRDAEFKSRNDEEKANKEAKLAVIEEIKAFTPSGNSDEDEQAIQALYDKFTAIGHTPFRDKEKIYNMFREAINPLMRNVRIVRRSAQLNLQRDKSSLRRQYDQLRQQLATYENNMGFFHNYSKDNPIIQELERKISNIRQDIDILRKTILEQEQQEQQGTTEAEPDKE